MGKWGRDFDAALKKSARTGKPVFAFFQEVPGCAGCQKFGAKVMSHAPIVEAVEREFIPVLIYNNRRGKDAEILKRYEEPPLPMKTMRTDSRTSLLALVDSQHLYQALFGDRATV